MDRQIAQTAGAQHGIITRQQVLGLGLDRHSIDHRVKTGRLYRVYPRR